MHIPFCKSKCYYCDFMSYCNEEINIKKYIECMKKEIKYKSLQLSKYSIEHKKAYIVDTIYIGGGTPSYIDANYIEELINESRRAFNVISNAEITIEVNPDSVLLEKLVKYKKSGINRISIGLQSTKNSILKTIGRIHNFEQFKHSYNLIKSVEFNNINIDLMLGLPNQSLDDLKEAIEEVINIQPTHISIYSLILENGTKLNDKIENGELELPNDILERKMYWYTKKTLEKYGFNHYEISNFAQKEKESKHNLNCWNQNQYLGIGLSAHSYFNSIRFSNIENLNEYIKNIEAENFEKNQIIHEILNLEEKQKEFMILGLRKIKGVEIKEFKARFAKNPIFVFRNELCKLQKENLVEIDGDYIKLTNKGLDLANIVWEEFV